VVVLSEDLEQVPVIRAAEDFTSFYRREYGPVVGLAFVLSGSHSAAEEIAQEAFAAAFRQWERVGHLESPGAWVRRVAVNRSVSRFRRLLVEARTLLRSSPKSEAYEAETVLVWEAVRGLPRRQAEAVALRYLHDLPLSEVAGVMKCSVDTVRTHLKRAHQKLAKELEP
jgi:RNA polymerase sigma-70 factor (ECF subfamily)